VIWKGGICMTGYVFCSKDPKHYDKINFYLEFNGSTYYLFTQHYSNTAYDRFKNKKRLDEALRHQNGIQLRSFNEKLPKFIKYIEDTENITILRKTARRIDKKNRKKPNIRQAA
jgi:hypothetical protein